MKVPGCSWIILGFTALALVVSVISSFPPSCDSDIYCFGPLLHVVQMSSIFQDSKTFVDMKMKFSRNETLRLFNEMMTRTHNTPSQDDVRLFVNQTFDEAGSEFETWIPGDWIQTPAFLDSIQDKELREWGSQLNFLWKFLGRKMKDDVKDNPDQYSIIYVPNPVIVPGGRFREFYYWDSYWIIRGLLLSEMFSTVKGMLSNFISVVDKIGFIPNGGRWYYAMRSQPPLLIPMVESYLAVTKDSEFLKQNIDTLEREFLFWTSNRTVDVHIGNKKYRLARYAETSSGPRPESYREDVHAVTGMKTDVEKEDLYSQIKSAAESGWDFSSRWFVLNGTNQGNLSNIRTKAIIPVDLNAILCGNAVQLSEFYKELGMEGKAAEYRQIADEWQKAVRAVLWHDEVGTWLDYDIENEVKRDYFFPSNLSPLWTKCYDKNLRDHYVTQSMSYLSKSKVMSAGGVPTTMFHTGEQWDYPNAWPPLQHILILGLDQTGDVWAKRLAFELAERWVRSNYKAYASTHAMFEKYDATVSGGHGGGGEYEVQLGFGWSNGVIMELLHRYGSQLTAVDYFEAETQYQSSAAATSLQAGFSPVQLLTIGLAFLATLSAGCIGFLLYTRYTSSKGYSQLAGKALNRSHF